MSDKFVGPKKVGTVIVDSLKTFGGNEVVIVHYENGDKEMMPKATFELVSTDIASDYTSVRAKKFAQLRLVLSPILAECFSHNGESEEVKKEKRTEMLKKALSAISEIDIKDSEVQPFFDQMLADFNSIINGVMYEFSTAMGRAINFLWTKDDTRFVAGTDVMYDRTYLEAKKIAQEIPEVALQNNEKPIE